MTKDHNPEAPDGARLAVYADTTRAARDLYVFADPCHWATATPGVRVSTVDDAVTALHEHLPLDASREPLAVEVGGYAGKSIDLQVPEDVVPSDCDEGEFRWLTAGPYRALRVQDPDQTDRLWILDVDGGVVIFDAVFFRHTPVKHIDELVAIAQSAQISGP